MPMNNQTLNPMMVARLCSEPWLVSAPILDAITADPMAFLRTYAAMPQADKAKEKDGPQYEVVDGVAIIRAEGMMISKWSRLLNDWGIVSTDVLADTVTAAAYDPAVAGIMLVIDSPGGMVTGVPEAARAVRNAATMKPTLAYNDGMMDSAAYWIGSQATAIYSTESGRTGSIGAYLAFMDFSKLAESVGIKVEVIRSAPHKGMGTPGTSLSDADRTALQTRIDTLGNDFIRAVMDARTQIADGHFNGLDFDATTAQKGGLIEGVKTRSEALAYLKADIETQRLGGSSK
jgi:signal peptide peptidase SppA